MAGRKFQRLIQAAPLFILFVAYAGIPSFAQDPASGLGRIYIQPVENNLDRYLDTELVRQRLPVVVAHSQDQADCVMVWTPGATNAGNTAAASASRSKITGNLALVDLQKRAVVWQTNVRSKDLGTLSPGAEKKLASQIVRKMHQNGAYCGGAAFSAPTQDAEDRIKAFKPPTFNW